MINERLPIGSPLPPDLLTRLRAVVERIGERRVARAVGLTATTIARALAGLALQRGSVALIEAGLAELEQPTGALTIAEHGAACAVCGRPIATGAEARQWFGTTLAHTSCADPFGGPRGT